MRRTGNIGLIGITAALLAAPAAASNVLVVFTFNGAPDPTSVAPDVNNTAGPANAMVTTYATGDGNAFTDADGNSYPAGQAPRFVATAPSAEIIYDYDPSSHPYQEISYDYFSTGFLHATLGYRTPGTQVFTPLPENSTDTYSPDGQWHRVVHDLSSIPDLATRTSLDIGYGPNYGDATGELRIDNVEIVPVPEASVTALFALGLVPLMPRRQSRP